MSYVAVGFYFGGVAVGFSAMGISEFRCPCRLSIFQNGQCRVSPVTPSRALIKDVVYVGRGRFDYGPLNRYTGLPWELCIRHAWRAAQTTDQ